MDGRRFFFWADHSGCSPGLSTSRLILIIQYPPGGTTDFEPAGPWPTGPRKYLGQPVICENRSACGGTVGSPLVAAKPADGYTIGIVTTLRPWPFIWEIEFSPSQ